ncbi:SURF1 family cytochrome oxidase biogenesis protein [Erythrobacter dokdonensis]|uniref:SURF1-like protein n=1 Tax=Erythrobacter dokdonensis DSW-74 TaxID=1300349 RepID=A0A1A7BG55_9SPHN|nr:SURF1 family cytochrome oxidase biogenesis protein [Erythrobacter dokdonensis]OBV11518.1 Threonine synthase [Erythrobacter dokdonensis DSW-74]
MSRRVPIIPTIIVLAAVATMIALGVWQLGRKTEKEALIARYEAALQDSSEVTWPAPADYRNALFRRTTIDCREVRGIDPISGKSAAGRSGWVHVARCSHGGSGVADVTIGWSRSPQSPQWSGGPVSGRIASYGDTIRLVAETPQAGLQPLAPPDPGDLPNNHLAYAGQWFFFALTALVIYVLALRRRRRVS